MPRWRYVGFALLGFALIVAVTLAGLGLWWIDHGSRYLTSRGRVVHITAPVWRPNWPVVVPVTLVALVGYVCLFDRMWEPD